MAKLPFNILLTFAILFCIYHSHTTADLVRHILKISYIDGYPDGIYANYILAVNGQFPGPTLEATVGDTVEITMINEIQDQQNVTLHWHGLHQRGSIFEDGVSMITQCPLAAGHSQVYRFNATQAGTYWYHSHFKSQYTEGLFGPMIIHGKTETYNYYGEATLMLSDWYHRSAQENEHWYLSQEAFGQPPKIDSTLINGMGNYQCPIALVQNLTCRSRQQFRPVIRVERNKPYRIRVINAASRTIFNFSISEHPLKVIEADGVDIVDGVAADVAQMSSGQRYSFLVKCPEDPRNGSRFLIRADGIMGHLALPVEGLININHWAAYVSPNATAILECTDDDLSSFPWRSQMTKEVYQWIPTPFDSTLIQTEHGPRLLDEMDLAPHDGISAPDHVDEEYMIEVTFRESVEDDVRHPNINYTTFTYPEDKPILHKVIAGEALQNEMISIEIKYGSVVQLIINSPFVNAHPFHLHGHHFWIVGLGNAEEGYYDPTKHNLTTNGVRRDSMLVPDRSWAVIRFVADNPGVWLFHCHLDWHAVGGMAMVFVEGKDILMEEVPLSKESLKVCDFLNNDTSLYK